MNEDKNDDQQLYEKQYFLWNIRKNKRNFYPDIFL
jgi:hypothetical protein